MAIKKYYVNSQKDGYQYDRKENKYFSWGYDIWIDGTRGSERGFYTREHAENAVKALKNRAKNEQYGITSPKGSPLLIELFQKKLHAMPKGPERARAKRVFQYFLALIPEKLKVIELKTMHLNTYQESRITDGVKNATIKREMVPIKEVLNNADQYFEELENYHAPRKPKLTIPKTRKTTTINLADRKKILAYLFAPKQDGEDLRKAASRRRVGLFLQLCLLTVSRPGETAALRRSDVDLQTGIVKIFGTKTQNHSHSVRELLITPTVRNILLERLEISQSEFLFTKSGKITQKWRDRLKEACEKVGVKYGKNTDDGIVFYTARHTATTVLAHSNQVDTKTAGQYTGHSDETMTLYYTHANRKTLEIAGEVLEENMGSKLLSGEFLEPKPQTQ